MSQSAFAVGQRVTLSDVGRQSLGSANLPIMGKVAKAKARYPDSVAVIIDGTTTPQHYNRSYWK